MKKPDTVLKEVEHLERQYRRPEAYNRMRNYLVQLTAPKVTVTESKGKKK